MGLGFLVAVTSGGAGEPIRFSKPAVALAAPTKEQSKLPEPRSKGMDFSAPDLEPPMAVPPQPVVRLQPRDEKREDLHWLLRTPKMFSDPDEPDSERSSPANPNFPGNVFLRPPGGSDPFVMPSPDSSRALAPVTDFNWDARDANHRSREGGKAAQNDARTRSPFAGHNVSDADSRLNAGRPALIRDLFNAQPKEKPRAVEIERQAAFHELLNPNAEPGGQGPNSLHPVVNAPDVKLPVLGIPSIAGQINSKSVDPMTAFNQRHERLRGSGVEDINKKYSTPPPPARPSLDPRLPPPLNRQPAVHEFPTRKF
jgi:hypothetical protein